MEIRRLLNMARGSRPSRCLEHVLSVNLVVMTRGNLVCYAFFFYNSCTLAVRVMFALGGSMREASILSNTVISKYNNPNHQLQ